MKVFCTDRALLYGEHYPSVPGNISTRDCYLRSDNALSNSGKYFCQPDWLGRLMYIPVGVLRMDKVAKGLSEQFVHRYCHWQGVGISYYSADTIRQAGGTYLDVQESMAYNFDGSVVLSENMENMPPVSVDEQELPLALMELSDGGNHVEPVVHSPFLLPTRAVVERFVVLISQRYLMKIGDIVLFPLWPAYRGIEAGTDILLSVGGEEVLYCGIK